MINKTFTFILFLSSNKFGFASNSWSCLSANITRHNVATGIVDIVMSYKNSDFQTSWNLRFSALEPEPSLVFGLDTSVDVASGRPASRSVYSTGLFLAGKN